MQRTLSDRLSGLSLNLKAVDSQLSESCELEEIKLKALNTGEIRLEKILIGLTRQIALCSV